ncbi:ATP-grasp fold amidoligase family protein, partial [Adlercreutzia sp.]|uniref:ATP-grasp fold amidoligase family protein n=1 Tax=Adlercreutzia sp. TaxID=1872387 RepID=UPI003FD72BC1
MKSINGKLFASLMQRCYDKVDVRGYILEKLGEARGEEILNELYGVYDSPEDIDFDELPDAFVLKVTQSSGFNIICPDKAKLDREDAVRRLAQWQRVSANAVNSFEEGYVYNGNPK